MSQKNEIRVESGDDSAFAKDSGKAGIVKDSQAGVVGDSAKVEGGIHQHTEQHFYQDPHLWFIVIALVCLIPVLVIFSRPDIEQGDNSSAIVIKNAELNQSPPIIGDNAKVIYGVSEERFEKLVTELGVTKSALVSFFKILEQKQVPPEDLDSTLRKIAERYKELQAKLAVPSILDFPEVTALKEKAKEALEKGDFGQAEKLLNESAEKELACAVRLENKARNCRLSAAESKVQNGDLANTQLEYKKAAGYYKEAADMLEGIPDTELTLAGYLQKQGDTCYYAGLYADAEKSFERVLKIREKHLGENHEDVAATLNNLALLYRAQGKYEEAEPLYKRALAISEKVLGPEHPDVATTLNNLALLYESQGKYEEAEPLYKRALAIFEKALGPNHPNTVTVRNNLSFILSQMTEQMNTAVRVQSTVEGSQAQKLNLKKGDIIASYNGIEITKAQELTEQAKKVPSDRSVKMTVFRDSRLMQFELKGGVIGCNIETATIPKEEYDLIQKQLAGLEG
ncbi:MAG: DUF2225 domain-containing protein [Desulfobacteraceae bacterium]|nr:DUF2225 domain-containing protein [Desulfobacteraceae bacterium]